jgi:hypothetical protein
MQMRGSRQLSLGPGSGDCRFSGSARVWATAQASNEYESDRSGRLHSGEADVRVRDRMLDFAHVELRRVLSRGSIRPGPRTRARACVAMRAPASVTRGRSLHATPKASRSTPTRLEAQGSAQPGLGEVKAADVLEGGECVSRNATVVQ